MKKIIVMLSLGVLVAGTSFAQNAPHKDKKSRTEHRRERDSFKDRERKSPEERATLRTERLSKQLDLNKSQTRKLQALNLKHAQEMEAMRAQYKNADKRGKNREAIKASHAKWEAELKDILNKKQYAKYEAERNEMRARREGKGHERGREFRGREFRQQRS